MRLFEGLDRTDYQDVLRALGYLCQSRGWCNLRIVECEDGLILQYTETREPANFATYHFSDDDLQVLLRNSYFRRRKSIGADEEVAAAPLRQGP